MYIYKSNEKKENFRFFFGFFFHFFIRFKCNSVSKCFKTYFYHKLNQKNERNISKKNLKFSFFSLDLYTYIVLKHLKYLQKNICKEKAKKLMEIPPFPN